MEGFGTLMLPGGDEYVGQMRAGKANGTGRYVDITGEIFEGHFVDGQRDGAGTTTLPNANSYRSKWVQGKETEDSRAVRLAQSNGQLAPGAPTTCASASASTRRKARDGDLVLCRVQRRPKVDDPAGQQTPDEHVEGQRRNRAARRRRRRRRNTASCQWFVVSCFL